MNTSRVVITAKGLIGKICSIAGWIWAIIMAIAMIILIADGGVFTDATEAVIGIILMGMFTAPAVVLIMIGHNIKQRIRRFRNYVSVLSSRDGSAHIEELALAVTKPAVFVLREVNSMINQRYFANATINPATGVVTINRQDNPYAHPPIMGMPSAGTGVNMSPVPPQPAIIESFTCTGCSAVGSRQKGSHGECDYCGTIAS